MMTTGAPCDQDGGFVPPNDPPPPYRPKPSIDDWTPYSSRAEFETAEFLYSHEQMSASNIDTLLNLWAATLAVHNDSPPFSNHTDLYSTIDASPLGDVAWENFSLTYNGVTPADNVPSWMSSEYDVWFRDPLKLVQNLLSNPDFDNEFDYAPLQEYDLDGKHRFQNLMSGDWAWKQAVSSHLPIYFVYVGLTFILRILSKTIPIPMAPCLYLSSSAAIKQLYQLLQAKMNTGLYISPSAISTTTFAEHIATVLCS